MTIYYPPVFINAYLKEKVSSEFGDSFSLPFFPVMPTDIDALTESFPNSDGTFAVFDRMFRMRRSPFPHIKCEQLLYYFYKMAGDPTRLIRTTQMVQDILDQGDESAQDLNAWISITQNGLNPLTPVLRDDPTPAQVQAGELGTPFPAVFFHAIKVYQLEEVRDVVDFGTARTFAGNKIIIDYDWHKS